MHQIFVLPLSRLRPLGHALVAPQLPLLLPLPVPLLGPSPPPLLLPLPLLLRLAQPLLRSGKHT